MVEASGYDVRVMARADLERTLDWAAAEGWNPGLDDAAAFHAADPLGFFMGWQAGEAAAAISLVTYDAGFGFLGLYIARPEFRGRGLALALWREALRRRPAKLIGLDGVVAQHANYARSGFRLAYRNIRFEGAAPAGGQSDGGKIAELVAAREAPFDRLAAYDRTCFPAPRPAFLSLWALQNLRDIADRCRDGQPLPPAVALWLSRSLEKYLDHRSPTLAAALGLQTPRGGVPWWREEAIRCRDAALRELARQFLSGQSTGKQAARIRAMAVGYQAVNWIFDRDQPEMPTRYRGTPKELLWRAFKSAAPMPLGERRLRCILSCQGSKGPPAPETAHCRVANQ